MALNNSQTIRLIDFDQLNIQLSLNGILQKHIDIKEIELSTIDFNSHEFGTIKQVGYFAEN